MPLYEYVCNACGEELERLQKISDPPLKDCPACQQPELVKKISAAAFRLKGGGWYETDFKQGQRRNVVGDGDKGEAKEAKSGDKAASADKGDAKSQTKGDKAEGKKSKSEAKPAQGAAAAS